MYFLDHSLLFSYYYPVFCMALCITSSV